MILAVCISWFLGATLGATIGALVMARMTSRHRYAVFEYGVELGARNERAKIVAWLRCQNRLASLDLEQILANEIEEGEHLK